MKGMVVGLSCLHYLIDGPLKQWAQHFTRDSIVPGLLDFLSPGTFWFEDLGPLVPGQNNFCFFCTFMHYKFSVATKDIIFVRWLLTDFEVTM